MRTEIVLVLCVLLWMAVACCDCTFRPVGIEKGAVQVSNTVVYYGDSDDAGL
jgi:hypothetical protein